MRCGHCGVESPAGMSFCGSCGFALSHGPLPFEQATGHGTAQRRHVTVMFCDLVDSTPLAEPHGTLSFAFTFTGQFDVTTEAEIRGRCHHPIVSGTEDFAGATGVLNFNDDVANGTAPYKGHIKLSGG